MSARHKSTVTLAFRIDTETARLLEDMVAQARNQGVNATMAAVARALLMQAIGIPQQQAAALETLMAAFRTQKALAQGIFDIFQANLPTLLKQALGDYEPIAVDDEAEEEPERMVG